MRGIESQKLFLINTVSIINSANVRIYNKCAWFFFIVFSTAFKVIKISNSRRRFSLSTTK